MYIPPYLLLPFMSVRNRVSMGRASKKTGNLRPSQRELAINRLGNKLRRPPFIRTLKRQNAMRQEAILAALRA